MSNIRKKISERYIKPLPESKNINNTVKYIYKKSMNHKNFNKKSKNILFFQRKEMLIISLVNEARRKSKNRRTCNYE